MCGLVALTAVACGPSEEGSLVKGSFETAHVAEAFRVFPPANTAALTRYIKAKNPRANSQLAAQVEVVGRCFGLDKRIFASLVAQESRFVVDAVSPTGATGLTQMTAIGLTEVNDQLGGRGARYARSAATDYFATAIDDCVNSSWTNLWQQSGSMTGMKNALKSSPTAALIAGAVLLKTNLSAEKTRNGTALMADLYRGALRRYNGDPAEKEHYQRVIMTSAARDF